MRAGVGAPFITGAVMEQPAAQPRHRSLDGAARAGEVWPCAERRAAFVCGEGAGGDSAASWSWTIGRGSHPRPPEAGWRMGDNGAQLPDQSDQRGHGIHEGCPQDATEHAEDGEGVHLAIEEQVAQILGLEVGQVEQLQRAEDARGAEDRGAAHRCEHRLPEMVDGVEGGGDFD